ncbi:MAG: ATP-grasp domain-containing protein [Oscillospiraceae bacterium]|nr:ATP-grasp domain-containing protein [Oscillospiraceae bacterium]
MGKKPFLPIILGSDENAYGMARAFHEKYGIISTLMCKAVYPATKFSKIVDIIKIDNLDREDVFAENIQKIAEKKSKDYDKLILVPCSDYYSEYASKNREIVEKYFCNRFIPYDLLQRFGTKEKFYRICDEYDLAYPKTAVCEKKHRLDISDSLPFDFPVMVKPDNSNSYDYLHSEFEGKKKVFFVWSREEYDKIITEMNKSSYEGNLIIQEYISGDDTTVRTLNCYSDNKGKVKLMCLGQPAIEAYAPLELGNYAALLTDCSAEIFGKIKNFLESINYIGFSNFDMKFDKKSGEYKLLDINPRQGRSSFFVTSAGYSLAEFLVENCVFEKNLETVYANSDWLWLSVPKKIIYDYVKNPEVLERAKRLIKEKKYAYTLLYKKDSGIKRYLYIKRYYNKRIKEYKKYFFEKT